ncbi:MAG: ferredoxin [Desulfuromonas sp.]|uniref:RnfABCDGE type electron transport complex subunit B n=1 Tax=Desulfuromonas sp. TaxID=892 RepID=UPI000CABA196|nr:RnfABCDGE type electron transport complex subunit B [Desulfuromonas sp.]PLX84319.1 MAG: ferredoxin [Desulfuromonas sp.]
MLEAVLSLGGIGLLAAAALGFAAKKFAVEVDPREAAILELLSGANCGACGYPGCGAFAKAVATGAAAPNECPAADSETSEQIGHVMGVEVEATEPHVAVVLCQGDNRKAKTKYRYLGLHDCNAAQKVADGPKSCPGGCLGLGTCARVCPFDAIEMTPDGLAVISREKCTGCRQCIAACPRQVIAMTPLDATVHVLCNSRDKAAAVRKYCQVGCIGCHICVKTVPEAYVIETFLARVNYEKRDQAAPAVEKCPTKCIRDFAEGYPEGSALAPPTVPLRRPAA